MKTQTSFTASYVIDFDNAPFPNFLHFRIAHTSPLEIPGRCLPY